MVAKKNLRVAIVKKTLLKNNTFQLQNKKQLSKQLEPITCTLEEKVYVCELFLFR